MYTRKKPRPQASRAFLVLLAAAVVVGTLWMIRIFVVFERSSSVGEDASLGSLVKRTGKLPVAANLTSPESTAAGDSKGLDTQIQKLASALEQHQQWQKEQVQGMQKALAELKEAVEEQLEKDKQSQGGEMATQRVALEELRQRVEETLRSTVEEQRGTLEEHSSMLAMIHRATLQREASWDYSRSAALHSQTRKREQGDKKAKEHPLASLGSQDLDDWEQRAFRRHGAYGFVRFSAYRTSRSRITAIGLGARAWAQARRLDWCLWVPDSLPHPASHSTTPSASSASGQQGPAEAKHEGHGPSPLSPTPSPSPSPSPINGTLSAKYDDEHHDLLYQTVVLHCDLRENMSTPGGHLLAKIDGELLLLYRETSAQVLDEPTKGPFLYELAYCGPPMFDRLEPRAVAEFVEYHHVYMGADHFILYDAGAADEALMRALGKYLDQGMVTITDFSGAKDWEIWTWAQTLSIHDCAYRLRPLAKWAFMQDLDEYFEVVPPQTVKQVLEVHEDAPWITTGCIVFSIHLCTGKPDNPLLLDEEASRKAGAGVNTSFLISRMRFRWPHVYCQAERIRDRNNCLGQLGHRKYIINPRKVYAMEIHEVLIPAAGGVHLSVEEARQSHFQGLAKQGEALCSEEAPDSWWLYYDRMHLISRQVAQCERDRRTKICPPGVSDIEARGTVSVQDWKATVSSGVS